jgi:heat shock protein HslJ
MRATLKRLVCALLIASALTGLSACSADPNTLDGTEWRLMEWSVSSVAASDFEITAAFSDGRISGKSGVNAYGGAYTLGPGERFSVGDLVSTLMAGPEPAMRAEQAFTGLLSAARSYKLAGGRLTLYDQGGNESLILQAVTY